eukprot:gb/GECH01002054.1/.p1 GENE.gb/GECH01002054.1/~~gb/GECH01002054.1/.p1  ORF type:complete len:436 (+),score=89.76 gb/GECH01002054.1/:1-1308(+)
MMISQFFVIAPRGDKIISRNYRDYSSKGSEDVFFRKVKFWEKGEAPPVFNIDGVTFIFMKKSQLYFVITTTSNVSPNLFLEFLHRVTRLFADYIGVLSEESMRKNFSLVYEILDEVIDYGYIQGASTEALKTYTFNKTSLVDSQRELFHMPFHLPDRKTTPSGSSHRPIKDSKRNKSELFVDILERINVVFNSNGNVSHSEIVGSIIMKSYLTGDPRIRIGLNEGLSVGRGAHKAYGSVSIDSCNFHNVVDASGFDTEKMFHLLPPDGEFTAMNYRITEQYNMPFRAMPTIRQCNPHQIEVGIRLRADFPIETEATNVLVCMPVPNDTKSVSVSLPIGAVGHSYEYKEKDKIVLWHMKKVKGGSEQMCIAKISLSQVISGNTKQEIGPLSLRFEIPMYNASGLKVRFLKIDERSKNTPNRWVRYITRSQSYTCRM